jgi:ribA/ribD-fused uncharacterized protein
MSNLVYKGRWVYNWFSNMELDPITIDGITYPSVENYYQGMKSGHPKILQIFSKLPPYQAKKEGKRLKLRDDWEQIKFDVMEKALRIKFAPGTSWYTKLKATEGEIVEWNNWGDKIWGKTLNGEGENNLGKILMKIRDEQIKKI